MPEIKVKEKYLKTVVGFNNSGLPLGKRDDLHLLLNDAIGEEDVIRDQHIINLFESYPTKAELKEMFIDEALHKANQIKASMKENDSVNQ